MTIRYRPEIDGLRSIAVCSVLVYHLKITTGSAGNYLFGGGFLGVDMFFVLSGFLITSILMREFNETGRISIADFYQRRARRILPALFLVLLLTLAAGAAILMPSELIALGDSAIASIFFVSNIYWVYELSAYGATESQFQPLLHTWSLAVEEQFYIFFPLALLVVLRWFPKRLNLVLVLGVIAGLVFAQMASIILPRWSFYWLPSRVWEMMAGGVLAGLTRTSPDLLRGPMADRFMPYIGLALVMVPIVSLNLDPAWHPGLLTVPVIAGTCMLIWWNAQTSAVMRLLSSAPLVKIGLISYSLYLWHYPVYVYGRMIAGDPQLLDYAIWIAISFAGAALSYRFIESPFRHKGRISLPTIVRGFGLATVGVVLLVGAVHWGRGFEQRFPRLLAAYGQSEMDNGFVGDESWSVLDSLAPGETVSGSNARDPSRSERLRAWFPAESDARNYLVVGNSHSKDTFNAFYLNRELFPGSAFARYAISDEFFPADVAVLRESPNYRNADEIIVSTRFMGSLDGLRRFAMQLREDGKALTILGPSPEYASRDNLPLFDWYKRRAPQGFTKDDLAALAWQERVPVSSELRRELTQIAEQSDASLHWKEELACDRTRQRCHVMTPDGLKVHYDYGHFSLDGARWIGRRMHDLGWF